MDNNKIMMGALIVIIAALLIAILAAIPNMDKQGTDLTFKGKSTLMEGDYLKIRLADVDGTAIANQTVDIIITDKDKSSDHHSVVTDSKGIGKFKLDKGAGKYVVTISYGGNENYGPSNATKKITVEEKAAEAVVEENSAGETSPNTHVVMGEDGYYALIDDDGNILEDLGPSKKHYPDNPNAVDYPDAEPMWNYIDKSMG